MTDELNLSSDILGAFVDETRAQKMKGKKKSMPMEKARYTDRKSSLLDVTPQKETGESKNNETMIADSNMKK